MKPDDRTNRLIKIQFVSNTEIPIENASGSNSYVLDFIRYLHQAGCQIEYLSLAKLPDCKFPWYIISSKLKQHATIRVRNNLQIGRVLLRFNSLLDWIITPIQLIYIYLPQYQKNIYRAARDGIQRLKQRYTLQATPKNVHLDWYKLLASSDDVAFAKTQFDRYQPDVVIVNYVFLAKLLDVFSPHENVLKVILTHDLFYKRTASFQKTNIFQDAANWDSQIEAMQLRKAQVILAIQEEDAQDINKILPERDVISMPISAVCHAHTVKQVPGRCLFVGSGVDHNYYGLKWFLENVWSKIIELIPNSNLHVCGTVCHRFEKAIPKVRFLGRVKDLKPEYGATEVCLVPLLAGSGLKIKLVEAMSYGRASVSTSIGVQGLREIVNKTTLIADTSEDFACAVCTLLSDPHRRKSMEAQAYTYVSEKLSGEAVYQPFVNYIHQHCVIPRGV